MSEIAIKSVCRALACEAPLWLRGCLRGASQAKALPLIPLTLLLVACQPSSTEEDGSSASAEPQYLTTSWPVARGNGSLSGSIPDKAIVSPRIAWSFEAESPISGDAGVYDGSVYFGTDDGVFFSVDLDTGADQWRFTAEDVIESEPAITEDAVYVGSNDGKFHALNRLTGELLWQLEFIDKVVAGANLVKSPIDGEQWLLVAGNDGLLRCLRAKDGSEVWAYETDNIINGSPAMIDDRRVIFGGCDAFLHIVDLEKGEALEQYETEAYIPCSVAVYEGIGYSGNYANQVIAFDPGDDGQLWTYEDKSFPFFSSPAVNEELVFIGSRDKNLHAIDRKTGEGRWTYRTSGRVDSSPLAFSDAVVFGSTDGWLYAMNQADGQELWKFELGGSLLASPVYSSGKLLIGTQSGTFFALESGESTS